MTSCKICQRKHIDGSTYCDHHHTAYTNLEEGYKQWRYALGVSWVEYLEKITKTSGTGRWVKEVADDILSGL
ncbi:MAG: hypothetical protein NWE89_05840 [Candidatus Bathyarchaeota archaeon]|nr:hypothetical protein [Candidatus Bathyarchaeota archaeon]